LFAGGPVGRNHAIALARVPGRPPEGFTPLDASRPATGAALGLLDLTREPAAYPPLDGLRLFDGHAGWSPGQLEAEVANDAWFVVTARPRDPFTPDPAALWAAVLRRQPLDLAIFHNFPDEVTQN
ncbi:MAG TPA: YqgE/AlgH family protein, partial [Miltoncostaeaceae bacterium]|nr:YqgE/AlgH family protein [Miltoncostaeaceae bacterium]